MSQPESDERVTDFAKMLSNGDGITPRLSLPVGAVTLDERRRLFDDDDCQRAARCRGRLGRFTDFCLSASYYQSRAHSAGETYGSNRRTPPPDLGSDGRMMRYDSAQIAGRAGQSRALHVAAS